MYLSAATLKLQKMVRGYVFYIGHTGTPAKAKLNAWADKSNAN